MINMATTVIPKSDQLNADDLIIGPRTITISQVLMCPEPDQPIAIRFEGDEDKPYKPCKSMRRVMISAWGPDGATYGGKRMTIFRDTNVMYGAVKVGGVRISHMSGLSQAMMVPLTESKKIRRPYTVQPLADSPPPPKKMSLVEWFEALGTELDAAADLAAVEHIAARDEIKTAREKLRPDAVARLNAMIETALVRHAIDNAPEHTASDFPGDQP